LKLLDELLEVECWIFHLEQVRFEPLQSHTFEVRLREGDFSAVRPEGLWMILEVELALHKENAELAGICPIKLVRFSDFSALRGFGGRATGGGMSELGDRTGQLAKCVARDALVVRVGVGVGVEIVLMEVIAIVRRFISWPISAPGKERRWWRTFAIKRTSVVRRS
jgi:hypothetical protein